MQGTIPAIWLLAATLSTMTPLSLTAVAILFRYDTLSPETPFIYGSP
jgi:hypothetical protein